MAEETRQNFFKEKYLPTLGDKGRNLLMHYIISSMMNCRSKHRWMVQGAI